MTDLNVGSSKLSIMDPLLVEALGFMQRSIACPEDVKARVAALRVPADDVTGTRLSTNWRSGFSGSSGSSGFASSGSGSASSVPGSGSVPSSSSRFASSGSNGFTGRGGGGGGFNRPSNRGGGGGGKGKWSDTMSSGSASQWQSRGSGSSGSGPSGSPVPSAGAGSSGPSAAGAGGPGPGRRPYLDRALAPRFGNKARADVTTEERMMDRIRDKMNKFSVLTYDATKAWLSQLLDSGETDFLTDFITLVFEKAAAEERFCALYARLITELRAEFPHLDSELRRIFGEFMSIFTEAADEPDVAAAEYKAFVALRERRRYRRGYAAFVGEVAKLKVLTVDDVTGTCNVILDGLIGAKAKEEQGLLCEEYADCLTSLMKSCVDLLKPSVSPILDRIKEAKNKDKDKSPSLTNKARFALMDLTDMF